MASKKPTTNTKRMALLDNVKLRTVRKSIFIYTNIRLSFTLSLSLSSRSKVVDTRAAGVTR